MSPLVLVALLTAVLHAPAVAQDLILHFLDVGQGDAVLIQAPEGHTALYDGGPPGTPLLQKLQALGVDRLDLVIASHAHADHIGGLPDVIRHYRPPFFLDNEIPHTTQAYRRLLESVRDAGSQLIEPTARQINLGSATLSILPPPGREGWGHNDNSVGVIVGYGQFRASLLGDAEDRLQAWWLQEHRGRLDPVAVHKASHHGSRNGDILPMMQRLAPEAVVIGVSANNRYGHPHSEAVNVYGAVGGEVYRTDRHGTVTVEANRNGTFSITPSRDVRPRAPPRGRTQVGATACVDLNRADLEALQRIVHIGPDRARQIIAMRPIRTVRDLQRISGVGSGRLRDIETQRLACVP